MGNVGSQQIEAARDAVSHPAHYAGDGQIECMDAMRSMMSGDAHALPATSAYWWGCAFKYLWRWRHKGGAEDLRKCAQCVGYLVAEVEGAETESGR